MDSATPDPDHSSFARELSQMIAAAKLIAGRSNDWRDAEGLAQHNEIDWDYVTHWAEVWEITDRLERLRAGLAE